MRHPKGARSIGIGHPRSGDRCTETRPYPLDPLRVAEQKSFFPATRKGSRPNAFAYTSVFGTSCLDRCLWNGHPCGCRYSFTGNSFDGLFLRHRQSGAKKGAKQSDDRFAPFFMHLASEDQKVHLAAIVGRTWKASGRRVLYSILSSVPIERLSSSGTPTN